MREPCLGRSRSHRFDESVKASRRDVGRSRFISAAVIPSTIRMSRWKAAPTSRAVAEECWPACWAPSYHLGLLVSSGSWAWAAWAWSHKAPTVNSSLSRLGASTRILRTLEGDPKVADFGLAKLLDSESEITRSVQCWAHPAIWPPSRPEGTPGGCLGRRPARPFAFLKHWISINISRSGCP